MKKTLLITLDFPPQLGGVANYWANLSKFLDSSNYLVLAPERLDTAEFDLQQPYYVVRKRLLFKMFWPRWFLLLWQTGKLVKQEKVENLIVTQVLPAGTVAWLLKKVFKLNYFVSFHGQDSVYAQRGLWKRFLLRQILYGAEKIIVNSHFTEKELLSFLPAIKNKMIIIYPCPNFASNKVDLADQEILAEKLQLKDKKVLLSVGRLVERKGFGAVVKSLASLVKQFPDLIYLIVGSGDYQVELQNLIQAQGLSECVKIITNVKDEELPLYYSLADIFVLPTQQLNNGDVEGFGIVYLEANLFGLPVIASTSGGASEAVENEVSGLVVEQNNLSALTQALEKLLNDPSLAKSLGKQGQARVVDKFSWDREADKLKELL